MRLALLALGVLVWFLLARVLYFRLPPGTDAPFLPVTSMVALNVRPWLAALGVFAVVAAISRRAGALVIDRSWSDVYFHALTAVAVGWFFFQCVWIISWGESLAPVDRAAKDAAAIGSRLEVVSLLGAGTLALILASTVLRRLQVTGALSAFIVFPILVGLVRRRQNLELLVRDLGSGSSLVPLAVSVPVIVLAWASLRTFRLRGDDHKPDLHLPLFAAGIVPFILQGMVTFSWEWTLDWMGAHDSAFLKTWAQRLSAPWIWYGLGVLLLVAFTPLSLRLLYPRSRLDVIYGAEADRAHRALTSWRAGYIPRVVGLLLFAEIAFNVSAEAHASIDLASYSEWPLMLTVTLAVLVRTAVERFRLIRAHGPTTPVGEVVGLLASTEARRVLSEASIASTTTAWTVHEVHPVPIPLGGEITIHVPATSAASARELLTRHFKDSNDRAARVL